MQVSRRRFVQAAMAGGAAALIPSGLVDLARAASRASLASGPSGPPGAGQASASPPSGYFLDARRWATCSALCSRAVPTGADPASDPGATEAHAVVFIDRYLSAFELPSDVADQPAIWVRGPFSGRNPWPDPSDGGPSRSYPPDSMLGVSGRGHFLAMTRPQRLAWLATLYGPEVLSAEVGASPGARAWAAQVRAGVIPAPPAGGQRALYADGLDAFDSWCESSFGTHYANADPEEQDTLLVLAAEPAGGAAGAVPLPAPAPPPAASALAPTLLVHTYQACYGLPEYRWQHSNPMWPLIGWDGDTQPLGNTIYDRNLAGASVDQGPNAGFGMEGVYQPRGGYVEYRPVSYLGPSAGGLSPQEESRWVPVILEALRRGRRP